MPLLPAASTLYGLTSLVFSMVILQRGAGGGASAGAGAGACFGCFGLVGFIIIAWFALAIALLVWVARDAKSRGMDSSVIWMILVMATSFVGLIIYLFARPQGNLIKCPHCGNSRLQASAKCPHCGNP